jgi:hypothetical protein
LRKYKENNGTIAAIVKSGNFDPVPKPKAYFLIHTVAYSANFESALLPIEAIKRLQRGFKGQTVNGC